MIRFDSLTLSNSHIAGNIDISKGTPTRPGFASHLTEVADQTVQFPITAFEDEFVTWPLRPLAHQSVKVLGRANGIGVPSGGKPGAE
jgi:hypothetical protein